jgi:transcriptional regulator with XRE-family HTH domain
MTIISPGEVQIKLAAFIRQRRLSREMTQQEMAQRSGVPLSTLRKFEQKGQVSLESFLKLLWVVGDLDTLMEAVKPEKPQFRSIDDVLKKDVVSTRQRGRRK